jgi:hypothetical protein
MGAPSRPLLGWATSFDDLDHDGAEDVVIFNGHVYPQATKLAMDSDYQQPPLVMRRVGARFEVVADPGPGLRGAYRDRTAVFNDLDNDGDIDIVVGELNGPLRVLRNMHDQSNDWIKVRLRGPTPGTSHGIGAWVELSTRTPAPRVLAKRWIWAGGPFQSTASTEVQFGVPNTWKDLQLEVRWPIAKGSTGFAPYAEVKYPVAPGSTVEFVHP